MARGRKPAPVTLTDAQRGRLERLWFIYGNHGSKTTPGNHQFIQGLLEHGLDLRPLQTKRTEKRDIPTAECVAAVEAILASSEDDEGGASHFGRLKLVPPPAASRRQEAHDLELKRMLDEMGQRLPATRYSGGPDAGGQDAALVKSGTADTEGGATITPR